jgi:hypothetical protein
MSDTVKVKLKTRLFVHGEARDKGTIVELPELAGDGEPFAVLFGEIVPDSTPVSNPVSGRTFGGLHDKDEDEEA